MKNKLQKGGSSLNSQTSAGPPLTTELLQNALAWHAGTPRLPDRPAFCHGLSPAHSPTSHTHFLKNEPTAMFLVYILVVVNDLLFCE